MDAAQCQTVLQGDPDNQEARYRFILKLCKSVRTQEASALVNRLFALRERQKTTRAYLMKQELAENVRCSAA